MRSDWIVPPEGESQWRPGRNPRLEERCIGMARVMMSFSEVVSAANNRAQGSMMEKALQQLEATARVFLDQWLEANVGTAYLQEPQSIYQASDSGDFVLTAAVIAVRGIMKYRVDLPRHFDTTSMHRFLNKGQYPKRFGG